MRRKFSVKLKWQNSFVNNFKINRVNSQNYTCTISKLIDFHRNGTIHFGNNATFLCQQRYAHSPLLPFKKRQAESRRACLQRWQPSNLDGTPTTYQLENKQK